MIADLAGRGTWFVIFGGLGYLAGSQWPAVSRLVDEYSLWLAIAILFILGAALIYRRRLKASG
jgi:membrane protein DedA with SNARE-associated domain